MCVCVCVYRYGGERPSAQRSAQRSGPIYMAVCVCVCTRGPRESASAYVSIRQHTYIYGGERPSGPPPPSESVRYAHVCSRMLTHADLSRSRINRGRICQRAGGASWRASGFSVFLISDCGLHSLRSRVWSEEAIREHTRAYVSMREHTWAYVSLRQHMSASVSRRGHA
jgi:hypothetical protein